MQAIAAILLLVLLAILLGGCSSTRYVPVETVRYDSLYFNTVLHDSIYIRDSLTVVLGGDTVYKERIRYEYILRTSTDTAYISRIDTVSVPYPVEAQLTRWQRACVWLGQAFAVCLALAVVALVGWLIYKKIIG